MIQVEITKDSNVSIQDNITIIKITICQKIIRCAKCWQFFYFRHCLNNIMTDDISSVTRYYAFS